jgi:predicted nucleic acid-binding Zn ribbon protein
MERASKVIRGLRLPADTFSAEDVVCAAWRGAVGKTIASHSRAVRLVRNRLVIEVEDRIWQRQLNGLSRSILRNLEKNLGAGLVEDLEFRVVPRRREPQRATVAMPAGAAADEAADIADPVLRAIYQASRKKAQA